jgi:hypothetical protein
MTSYVPLPFGAAVEVAPDRAPRIPAWWRSSRSDDTVRLTLSVPPALERGIRGSADLAGTTPEAWLADAIARSIDPRVAGPAPAGS